MASEYSASGLDRQIVPRPKPRDFKLSSCAPSISSPFPPTPSLIGRFAFPETHTTKCPTQKIPLTPSTRVAMTFSVTRVMRMLRPPRSASSTTMTSLQTLKEIATRATVTKMMIRCSFRLGIELLWVSRRIGIESRNPRMAR